MHAHIYLFWSYREDGELEDGEIDDEGISIEEVKETKEESEEAEKDKDKEKEREKDDKSHRHSRKRHRKIKEKRRSKRRRRDRQKVIYHCGFFFWQMSIVFTFSFMLFFPMFFQFSITLHLVALARTAMTQIMSVKTDLRAKRAKEHIVTMTESWHR